MELKLNIYEKRKIIKTYRTETYDIMFGTVEDLINIIDLDKMKSGSDSEVIKLVGEVVMNGLGVIKPLLKDMFDGLTDEELRNTRVSEIATVLVEVVKFAITQMGSGSNGKN